MKNGDMPINATSPNKHQSEWAAARAGGLTKREYFSGLAFQTVMSGMYDPKVNHDWSFKDFASEAVNAADALLKELEK